MSSRSSRHADVEPGSARALLRLSKGFGRDAARSHQNGFWQHTERAAARSAGRAGHRLDRRNPRRVGGLATSAVLGTVGLAVLVLVVRRGRRAR
jgi:hypothetical protein